tara:strand:+ start:892 stop:1092 length:201 start_codon:yes stop_codon:yes gene_type:complete
MEKEKNIFVYEGEDGSMKLVKGKHLIPSNLVWVELASVPNQIKKSEWKIVNGVLMDNDNNIIPPRK